MTLSKPIRAQEGVLISQSSSPTTKRAWIGQTMSKIIPKIARYALSGYLTGVTLVTNCSIHIQQMPQCKGIRVQEGVPIAQSDSPINKMAWIGQKTREIIPQIAHSALSGHPTGVTSANNHSYFNKWPWGKLLGLKKGFLQHTVAPRSLKWPELVTRMGKIIPKLVHVPLCQGMDPTAVTSVSNFCIFIKWS